MVSYKTAVELVDGFPIFSNLEDLSICSTQGLTLRSTGIQLVRATTNLLYNMAYPVKGLNDPIVDAPPGQISNLKDPYSLHSYNVATQIVCLTITTILVSIRIYTKWRVLRSLAWDDYTSIIAHVGLLAYGIVLFEMDRHGNGTHLWNVSVGNFIQETLLAHASEILYSVTICVTKISILSLYIQLFSPVQTARILVHFLLWVNVVYYIVGCFVEAFQCQPRMRIWEPWVAGTCFNQTAIQLSSAVINTCSDFAILLLPMMTVWHLNVKKNTKLGLLAIFSTGLL